ncbi:hypothetical protein HOG21_01040 [bacterium]|nr:hypothetical protein [bacterium]
MIACTASTVLPVPVGHGNNTFFHVSIFSCISSINFCLDGVITKPVSSNCFLYFFKV